MSPLLQQSSKGNKHVNTIFEYSELMLDSENDYIHGMYIKNNVNMLWAYIAFLRKQFYICT